MSLPKYPDINFENIISAQVTKYVVVNLYVQMLYDRQIDRAARFFRHLSSLPKQCIGEEHFFVLQGRIHIPLEYIKKKNGNVFPVEISGDIFLHKKEKKIFCVLRDISEHKKMEDVLKKFIDAFRYEGD